MLSLPLRRTVVALRHEFALNGLGQRGFGIFGAKGLKGHKGPKGRELSNRTPGNLVAFKSIRVLFPVSIERSGWDRTRGCSRNRHDFDDPR